MGRRSISERRVSILIDIIKAMERKKIEMEITIVGSMPSDGHIEKELKERFEQSLRPNDRVAMVNEIKFINSITDSLENDFEKENKELKKRLKESERRLEEVSSLIAQLHQICMEQEE